MIAAVTPVPVLEATPSSVAPAAPAQPEPRARVPEAAPEPLLRLVIEEDPASGQFVYKTMDRITGEVISQLPREEVVRMMAADDYAPGDLIEIEA
jgi:flagellar protein FlaG